MLKNKTKQNITLIKAEYYYISHNITSHLFLGNHEMT